MKIEQNEKRTKQEVNQKRKNHLRDGLPAEGYEGAREGHILTPRPVVAQPGSPLGVSLREKEDFFKNRRSSTSGVVKVAAEYVYRRLPCELTCVVVWEAE